MSPTRRLAFAGQPQPCPRCTTPVLTADHDRWHAQMDTVAKGLPVQLASRAVELLALLVSTEVTEPDQVVRLVLDAGWRPPVPEDVQDPAGTGDLLAEIEEPTR